ncbi:Mitochondrial matrix cochaperone [Apophysomyces ossiformis]|uniref:GrpE protein homolog n=1 Tax=Apophysomyces ossiformis TaxID=679940 RepID=A0A8H7BTH8_9FUNG|nr:Mitochondrial matrix cochaperone [Apophysomyces ossiformis]
MFGSLEISSATAYLQTLIPEMAYWEEQIKDKNPTSSDSRYMYQSKVHLKLWRDRTEKFIIVIDMIGVGALCKLRVGRTYTTANDNDEGKPTTAENPEKNEETPPPPKAETSQNDEMVQQLTEKDKKFAELQASVTVVGWTGRRLKAESDQENLRQRSAKEVSNAREYAIQKFAKDILDTVDILGMALASVPVELRSKETAPTSQIADDPLKLTEQLTNLYTGVSMTEAELVKTLRRHGIEQHNPEGEKFDPNKHQAVFQTPIPDKEPGTVFTVQKLGYVIKGRVLRPAQVGVVAEKT